MNNKRYAVIVTLRNQVTAFVNDPKQITCANALIVDLKNHPQKDEVQMDWFYDKSSNSFSKDGVVVYRKSVDNSSQLDRMEALLNKSEALLNKSNEELRQEGADALLLELIERGAL